MEIKLAPKVKEFTEGYLDKDFGLRCAELQAEWMIEEIEYMFGDWVEWDSMEQKIEDSFKEEEKKE